MPTTTNLKLINLVTNGDGDDDSGAPMTPPIGGPPITASSITGNRANRPIVVSIMTGSDSPRGSLSPAAIGLVSPIANGRIAGMIMSNRNA